MIVIDQQFIVNGCKLNSLYRVAIECAIESIMASHGLFSIVVSPSEMCRKLGNRVMPKNKLACFKTIKNPWTSSFGYDGIQTSLEYEAFFAAIAFWEVMDKFEIN